MGRTTQRIKISLTKPLKSLLNQRANQDRLEKRMEELERRLEQLERDHTTTTPAASAIDPGIFWTDADEPPALKQQQRSSYEAWQAHYNLHPDEIEPGEQPMKWPRCKRQHKSQSGEGVLIRSLEPKPDPLKTTSFQQLFHRCLPADQRQQRGFKRPPGKTLLPLTKPEVKLYRLSAISPRSIASTQYFPSNAQDKCKPDVF